MSDMSQAELWLVAVVAVVHAVPVMLMRQGV
jgi:hypothetical protein